MSKYKSNFKEDIYVQMHLFEFWCKRKTRFKTYFSPRCYLIVSKSGPVGVFIFIGKKIQRILLLCPPKFLDLPQFLNISSVCLKLWNLNNFNVGVFEEVSTAGKSVRVRVSDTQRCVSATRSRSVTISVHIRLFNLHPAKWFEGYPVKSTQMFTECHLRFFRVVSNQIFFQGSSLKQRWQMDTRGDLIKTQHCAGMPAVALVLWWLAKMLWRQELYASQHFWACNKLTL